jgi:hypothetical protein
MANEDLQFASEIAVGAEKYLSYENELELIEDAVRGWAESNKASGAPHPSLDGLRDFIKRVISDVVKELSAKYSDITVVTLTLITQTLLSVLSEKYGWTSTLVVYRIPLEILTALVYKKILKTLRGNL